MSQESSDESEYTREDALRDIKETEELLLSLTSEGTRTMQLEAAAAQLVELSVCLRHIHPLTFRF